MRDGGGWPRDWWEEAWEARRAVKPERGRMMREIEEEVVGGIGRAFSGSSLSGEGRGVRIPGWVSVGEWEDQAIAKGWEVQRPREGIVR